MPDHVECAESFTVVTRGARALTHALKTAPELTDSSAHRFAHLRGIDDLTRTATLLPPIDQHGFTPYAADLPLTPRSVSQLARAAAAGKVTAHRAVLDNSFGPDRHPRKASARIITSEF